MTREEKLSAAALALFIHECDFEYREDMGEYVCPFCGAHGAKDEDGRWLRCRAPEHGPGLICPWGLLREAMEEEVKP